MRHQRRLNLRRSQTVTRDVQHVVHAPGDPVIAIFIATRAVAAEIHIFEGGEVGLLKTFVIAKQRTRLTRPGVGDHQTAFGGPLQRVTFVIDQRRLHAEERTCCRTGFQLGSARQWCDHETASFGLPPGVDHRAFLVADLLPVPLPRFRVNWLAHGTENAQRRTVGAFDRFIAFRHQRANRRGRGIENIDLMLVHHLRHTGRRRPVRYAFKHQRGRAAGQRAVQQITVSGNPTHISGAPVDIARMIIKDIFKGQRRIHQITAGSMQHAFRLPGRPGGVENKQRIFGVHLFRLVLIAGLLNQVVPPQVAPFLPVDFSASTLQYHHMLYAGDVRVFQRVINVFLQRNTTPGTHTFVGSDHQS